jgi:hypothetical protein
LSKKKKKVRRRRRRRKEDAANEIKRIEKQLLMLKKNMEVCRPMFLFIIT